MEALMTWHDNVLSLPPEESTPPGEFVTIEGAASPEMRIQAAVFADGAVVGSQSCVETILKARRAVYQDIPKAIDMLTRSASIDEFRAWQDSYNHSTLSKERFSAQIFAGGPAALAFLMPAHPVASLHVIDMLEKGKDRADIVLLLRNWRDRLAGSKPSIINSLEILR